MHLKGSTSIATGLGVLLISPKHTVFERDASARALPLVSIPADLCFAAITGLNKFALDQKCQAHAHQR